MHAGQIRKGGVDAAMAMHAGGSMGDARRATSQALLLAILAPVVLGAVSAHSESAGLTVAGGVLAPEFDRDQTSYDVWAYDDRLAITTNATADMIGLRASDPDGSPLTVTGGGTITGLAAGRNAISVEIDWENGARRSYAFAAHYAGESAPVETGDIILPSEDCFADDGEFDPEGCFATRNGVSGVMGRKVVGAVETPLTEPSTDGLLATDLEFEVGRMTVHIGSIRMVSPEDLDENGMVEKPSTDPVDADSVFRIDEGGVVEGFSGHIFAAYPELRDKGLVGSGTAAEQGKFPVWRDYLPISKVAPRYPRRARARGIQGHVLAEFCVTPSGKVDRIRIIEESPPGVFAEAATEATRQFRYEPRVVLGRPVKVCGVRNLLMFELSG